MDNFKKAGIIIVSLLIAVLFSLSSNNYPVEVISNDYLKEVKASDQSSLIHFTYENYYLHPSSNETFPSPGFEKTAYQEVNSLPLLLLIECSFHFKKIIFHRLNSSEIVFPTHFFW